MIFIGVSAQKVTRNFCHDRIYEFFEIWAGCWIKGFSDLPEVSRNNMLAASGRDEGGGVIIRIPL